MWKHLRKKKEQSQVYKVSPDWFFQRATRKYEDTIRKLFIYIYVCIKICEPLMYRFPTQERDTGGSCAYSRELRKGVRLAKVFTRWSKEIRVAETEGRSAGVVNLREMRVNVMTMFKEKFRRLARYNNTSHCCSRLHTTLEIPGDAKVGRELSAIPTANRIRAICELVYVHSIYIYIYISQNTHTHICIYTHTCIFIYVHICMYTCVHV